MNPNAPSGNQNQFFGQKVSIPGINVNNAADNQLIYKNDYSSELFYNSNGIPTVLLGLRKSVTPNQQGLFVSQSGIDVTQATNAQLIFNSNQNIFKIVEKGTATIGSFSGGSAGPNFAIITVPHNLGFTPIANIYAQAVLINYMTSDIITSSYVPLPIMAGTGVASYWFPDSGIGFLYPLTILFGIDDTNIYIEAIASIVTGPSYTVAPIPFTYFLLQETAVI